ncbi:MAG: hypothetical protein M0R51_13540 [Clostridia bacterium]|jgi:hypothetical protein|nr:hypothetical protein [Clostridia bacterium]
MTQTQRNRRQIIFQYRNDKTTFYTIRSFKYPKLAKEFYDNELSDKEKQKCDMMVKIITPTKQESFVIINRMILEQLCGAGNKSPKLVRGKRR